MCTLTDTNNASNHPYAQATAQFTGTAAVLTLTLAASPALTVAFVAYAGTAAGEVVCAGEVVVPGRAVAPVVAVQVLLSAEAVRAMGPASGSRKQGQGAEKQGRRKRRKRASTGAAGAGAGAATVPGTAASEGIVAPANDTAQATLLRALESRVKHAWSVAAMRRLLVV